MGSHEHGEGATDADFDRVTQTHLEFFQSYVGRYTLVECTRQKESCIAFPVCFIGSNQTPLN